MEIARILEKLKESPCTWNYFGPPSEEVFAVSLTGSGAHFHSGVLCINTTDRYQYAHLYENMCILVTEPYHASRLFEIIQQLLLEDIRLTNSVLSLQKSWRKAAAPTTLLRLFLMCWKTRCCSFPPMERLWPASGFLPGIRL